MDRREKQIIRRNEKFLRDNVDTKTLEAHLIQNSAITTDDAERIQKEITSSDKVHRLLRIIETHPNGFKLFHEALVECNIGFVAERLDNTEVDENHLQQEEHEPEDGSLLDVSWQEIVASTPLFKCDVCANTFVSKVALVQHLKEHTITNTEPSRPIKDHLCDVCGINCKSTVSLKIHKITKHDKPDYVKFNLLVCV